MLDVGLKLTSALRRIEPVHALTYIDAPGSEGDVCAFQLAHDGAPFVVEAVSCRSMIVAPGDVFLATPGYREFTRWVAGEIPAGGLVPGRRYWVLAPSGVVGDLVSDFPLSNGHLAEVAFLGVVTGAGGDPLNIGRFALIAAKAAPDRGAPVFVILGTSAEVGKTTAGTTILRALRQAGRHSIVVLEGDRHVLPWRARGLSRLRSHGGLRLRRFRPAHHIPFGPAGHRGHLRPGDRLVPLAREPMPSSSSAVATSSGRTCRRSWRA